MKTRLQYIITNEGLTNIRFAELLGVNPASISHILAERNKPSFDFVVKIAENLPQYNLRWLLTGKGEPITSPVKSEPSVMTKNTPTSKLIVCFPDGTFEEFSRR